MPVGATGAGSVRLFIKINGLEGESSLKPWKDKNYSDIDSFSLGASASWEFGRGKSASGGTSFSGVAIQRSVVGSSPLLFIGCLKEKQTDLAEVVLGNEAGTAELFVIRLKGEVRITSHSLSGATGGDLVESIVLTAPILEIEHKGKNKKDDIDWSDIKQKNDKLG
jgi:type VI secretion system secreted protein Hcp